MAKKRPLNPAALSLPEASQTLAVPLAWLEADVAAGAPQNADGTLNLAHYGAWLLRQAREGSPGEG